MPGLKPYYRPEFRPKQVQEASRPCGMKKHTAPFNMVKRAQLILLLHEKPDIENTVAARQLGRHKNWVRYWRKRWATDGFSLVDKPRSSRPRTYSLRDHALDKASVCEFPTQRERPLSRYSTMDIVRVVKTEEMFDHMSASTVWRILDQDVIKAWRFRSWIFPRDPLFC